MKTNDREILFYFDPQSPSQRECRAHAKSLASHLITYSFEQSPSNGTSWRQIITYLGKHPKELMNKAHPYYQANLRGRDFDDEAWLKILAHNPSLFKAPIAVRGRRAVFCETPTDIYRLAR
ncbi:MAG: ArsC/Spx/MgsR family protein [Bacteroidota bacterium]